MRRQPSGASDIGLGEGLGVMRTKRMNPDFPPVITRGRNKRCYEEPNTVQHPAEANELLLPSRSRTEDLEIAENTTVSRSAN